VVRPKNTRGSFTIRRNYQRTYGGEGDTQESITLYGEKDAIEHAEARLKAWRDESQVEHATE
jgi:hypothetical protein